MSAVETTFPYSSNVQPHTHNVDDIFMAEGSWGPGVNPVMQYVWLGDTPSKGLLAWITIGVNLTAEYDPAHAAILGAYGGVMDDTGVKPVFNPPTGVMAQLGGSAAYFSSLANVNGGGGAMAIATKSASSSLSEDRGVVRHAVPITRNVRLDSGDRDSDRHTSA